MAIAWWPFPTTACGRSCAATCAWRRRPGQGSRVRRRRLIPSAVLLLFAVSCNWIREGRWQVYQDDGTKALEQRRYGEAEKQWKKSLAIAEGFGAQDPRLGTSLNSLGRLYAAQGRYAEAEPLYAKALAVWESTWGPEHPAVAKALDNLAALHYAQGRYAEAEPLYKRALEIKTKALGPAHPDLATTEHNLGSLYRAQGR